MSNPTPERIAADTELCACCGRLRPDVEEYTGCPGPICKDCHREWTEGQRENPEW